MVRGPMRLDNRTQALLITGEALSDPSSRDELKRYFAGTGGELEEVPEGVKVGYKTREAAEKVRSLVECPALSTGRGV